MNYAITVTRLLYSCSYQTFDRRVTSVTQPHTNGITKPGPGPGCQQSSHAHGISNRVVEKTILPNNRSRPCTHFWLQNSYITFRYCEITSNCQVIGISASRNNYHFDNLATQIASLVNTISTYCTGPWCRYKSGYATAPHSMDTAHNLQSTFVNPSVLGDPLAQNAFKLEPFIALTCMHLWVSAVTIL